VGVESVAYGSRVVSLLSKLPVRVPSVTGVVVPFVIVTHRFPLEVPVHPS